MLVKESFFLFVHRGRENINNVYLIFLLNQHVMLAISFRNLGIMVYAKFSFREHISQICSALTELVRLPGGATEPVGPD